ncbi:hypothetical protein SAMN04488128_101396 [Chitinophaga eiseniae]|uniref:Uncharacterized protein n=1 Tax=Chitinophaga eiseniae TaxID=634771 RepID=A0A1T4KZP4_9BACT|nr:hypothetical protein [Chitinophaga eiseniae]SJZ47808.1 hypothetical protein SAMN04488128_101396 [Chitinophaga eiseniae]
MKKLTYIGWLGMIGIITTGFGIIRILSQVVRAPFSGRRRQYDLRCAACTGLCNGMAVSFDHLWMSVGTAVSGMVITTHSVAYAP